MKIDLIFSYRENDFKILRFRGELKISSLIFLRVYDELSFNLCMEVPSFKILLSCSFLFHIFRTCFFISFSLRKPFSYRANCSSSHFVTYIFI